MIALKKAGQSRLPLLEVPPHRNEYRVGTLKFGDGPDLFCGQISSATMASIALGLEKNFYHGCFDAPFDPADLNRCMLLVEDIPEIKDSFPAIAKRVKKFAPILREWDRLTGLLKEELKRPDERAPETYALMKELLKAA